MDAKRWMVGIGTLALTGAGCVGNVQAPTAVPPPVGDGEAAGAPEPGPRAALPARIGADEAQEVLVSPPRELLAASAAPGKPAATPQPGAKPAWTPPPKPPSWAPKPPGTPQPRPSWAPRPSARPSAAPHPSSRPSSRPPSARPSSRDHDDRGFRWLRGWQPSFLRDYADLYYYPFGNYLFPYYYDAGSYYPYRSAYSPFFSYEGGSWSPYYYDNVGSAAPEREARVVMAEGRFWPEEVRLVAGGTVVWLNADAMIHNATADAGGTVFATQPVDPGTVSETLTFARPGRYDYHCSYHPTTMRATIIVE